MTRAAKYTPTTKKVETYSDLPINFDLNPITKNLARITNERAVLYSINTLIMTRQNERMFQPLIHSTVQNSLFDPLDYISGARLEQSIKDVINKYEPRARVVSVTAIPDDTNNAYNVDIVFSLINNTAKVFKTTLLLNRAR